MDPYITSTYLVYLRYISGISEIYFRYISGISQVYNWYISAIFQVLPSSASTSSSTLAEVSLSFHSSKATRAPTRPDN